MSVQVTVKSEDVERIKGILSGIPGGAQKAMSAAINRGLSKVRTSSYKEVRKVYTADSAAMRANTSTSMKSASGGNMVGYIRFSGTKIPLYKFTVSPKAANTRQQVSAGLMKGNMTPFTSAFITVVGSGHIGVFERKGVKRYPIEEKVGLSMAQMVGNSDVSEEVANAAQEVVDQRLEHEINRILNSYGG